MSCWLLTNTAVTSAVTNFRCHKLIAKVDRYKNSDMENFIWNQYGERFAILDIENIKICRWITKLEAISLRFLQYMQNIWFIISQGSVATCLRWGEWFHMRFVANFIRFPAVPKLWKSLRFYKVTDSEKVGTLFETHWTFVSCTFSFSLYTRTEMVNWI